MNAVKKTYLSILAIVFASSLIHDAEAQNLPTTIRIQAMDMANAFIKNDFATFSKYMHPNIISFAGGKERMKSAMDSASAAMKLFGVAFKRYWIGKPGKIVDYNDQLQAVLPTSTVMKTPLGELYAESSMIVVSLDKGKNWYFIDTNVYKVDKLKDILPGISPKLTIPPMKKPRLVASKTSD